MKYNYYLIDSNDNGDDQIGDITRVYTISCDIMLDYVSSIQIRYGIIVGYFKVCVKATAPNVVL